VRNVSDKRSRETQNTHFVFSNFSGGAKIIPFNEIMWEYGTGGEATDDNITRRIRFASWINKATNAHSEYVILFALTQLHKSASL